MDVLHIQPFIMQHCPCNISPVQWHSFKVSPTQHWLCFSWILEMFNSFSPTSKEKTLARQTVASSSPPSIFHVFNMRHICIKVVRYLLCLAGDKQVHLWLFHIPLFIYWASYGHYFLWNPSFVLRFSVKGIYQLRKNKLFFELKIHFNLYLIIYI